MKKIQAVVACGIAMALFCATNTFAADAGGQTKATVRAAHGDCTYNAGGGWQALRPNMELDPGVQIKTGPDSYADLNVNGHRSSVRVSQNTQVSIDRMSTTGGGGDADSDTSMKLDAGTVLGQVKKLSANSRYEIVTPNGVAGIRGTDFSVSVTLKPDGSYTITFSSVTGTVVASGVLPDGTTIVKVLTAGQSWTIGQDVVPTPLQLLDYQQQIVALLGSYTGGPLTLPTPPFVAPFNNSGSTPQTGNGSQTGTTVTQ